MRTFVGLPSTINVTFCKLGFHFLRVARKEWERLFPDIGPLPVISHTLDIRHTPFQVIKCLINLT